MYIDIFIYLHINKLYISVYCTTIGTKVFIFGGNDGKSLFNDLHILDTETMSWTPTLQHGLIPSPRAGILFIIRLVYNLL